MWTHYLTQRQPFTIWAWASGGLAVDEHKWAWLARKFEIVIAAKSVLTYVIASLRMPPFYYPIFPVASISQVSILPFMQIFICDICFIEVVSSGNVMLELMPHFPARLRLTRISLSPPTEFKECLPLLLLTPLWLLIHDCATLISLFDCCYYAE